MVYLVGGNPDDSVTKVDREKASVFSLDFSTLEALGEMVLSVSTDHKIEFISVGLTVILPSVVQGGSVESLFRVARFFDVHGQWIQKLSVNSVVRGSDYRVEISTYYQSVKQLSTFRLRCVDLPTNKTLFLFSKVHFQAALAMDPNNWDSIAQVISLSPNPMALLDRQSKLLALSEGWCAQLPVESENWQGQPLTSVFPFQFSGWAMACEDCLKGFSHCGPVEKFVDAQLVERTLQWQLRPWWTDVGHVGGIILYVEEMTCQVQLEKELEEARANRVLAAQLSAVGEMAASVAHEINNPLAILQGKATILQKLGRQGTLSIEKVIQEADKMIHASMRISKILQSLRFVARNGDQDPLVSCHVLSVLEEVLELAEDRFRNHNIDLRLNVDRQHWVLCRQVQLGQVLLNLMNNAFDAVYGNAGAWLEVRSFVLADKVYLAVTDSGQGLVPEVAEKIMRPFFTTKGLGKGTGLGLSISQAIIEGHGGRLFLDDSGPHTCFVIELPKAIEAANEIAC